MLRKSFPRFQYTKHSFDQCRMLFANASVAYGNMSLGRQSKIMGKFIGERVKGSKKHWYPSHETSAKETPDGIFASAQLGRVSSAARRGTSSKNNSRRINVLNKLFMTHVTDLLATGEASDSIFGRGLQISRVKITSDFTHLNVYWLGNGDPVADGQLEKELKRCSGQLRHDLSQLTLMGEVPRIKFVRDKTNDNITQVEALLKTMNFELSESDSEENVQHIELHQNNTTNPFKCELFTGPNQKSNAVRLTHVPEIRHDVLGLDHTDIMIKILTKMRKSKQAWLTHNQETTVSTSGTTVDETPLEQIRQRLANATESADKFEKFLAKRREYRNTPERKKSHRENICTDYEQLHDEDFIQHYDYEDEV